METKSFASGSRLNCIHGHHHKTRNAAELCMGVAKTAEYESACARESRLRYLKGVEMIRAGQWNQARKQLITGDSDMRLDCLLNLELEWAPILERFGFAGKLLFETPFAITRKLSDLPAFWTDYRGGSYLDASLMLCEALAQVLKAGVSDLSKLDGMSDDEFWAALKGKAVNPAAVYERVMAWRTRVSKGDAPDPLFTVTDLDDLVFDPYQRARLGSVNVHTVSDLLQAPPKALTRLMDGMGTFRRRVSEMGLTLRTS